MLFRSHAVAVVDHDVVAPAAVPAVGRAHDRAGVCRVDRAAVACADVGAAVIFKFARYGVDARTLTARYVGAVARPYKVSGADGAARIACVALLLLLLLLAVELGDLLLNVGVESLFLSGQLA